MLLVEASNNIDGDDDNRATNSHDTAWHDVEQPTQVAIKNGGFCNDKHESLESPPGTFNTLEASFWLSR